MAPDIVSHLSPPRPHVTLSLRSAPLLTTLAFLVLLLVPCAVAQNTPDDLAGIREGSPYNVSDFDAVNVATGSLTLHIPLLSYPQRGALKVEYELLYNGQMTQQQTSCDERQGTCNPPLFSWSLLPRGVYANEVNQPNVNSKLIRFIWPNVTTYNYSAYIRTVREADGATHILGNMGTNTLPPAGGLIIESGPWRALDGTGWELLTDGITLISSAGVRFAGGGTDTNGNQIQYTTSGITDTLGRQLPPLPSSTSASNTDASGCTGPLATTSAVLWSPPALQGGTANYKFCYATVQVFAKAYEASNGATFPQVMLQSVVLPNGTTWTFEYSDRNSGDASTVNYGSLTTITLPTGGTVSYTYADGSMFAWGENCGIQQLSTTSVSRWVTSKTVTDQTGAHTWTYGGGKVAAPDGSSTVHQFIVDYQGTPHETGTLYYNTAGTLLKNVQTTYNTPVTTCYQGVVNYLPLTRTTTLDNSQVTKETYTYDTGFTFLDLLGSPRSYAANYGKVTSTTAYDYGNPSAGAPLRTTNTSYAWQNPNPNYSTYLSNNLLNLSSQVAVFSGTGSSGACGANGSVACTTYGYDEASLQSSGVSKQHVAGQAYAGNQTSVHRWLNGSTVAQAPCNISVSNGYLVSNNVYYDTGELQKSTDPCLYSTTFQYNSASPFFGAYLTKVTNALNQSTSYGYDSNTGVVTSITDPNSQTTIKTYDNMERLATVTYPSSDASGNGGGTATYTYTDTPGSLSLEVKRSIDGTRSTDEVALFDGLGREISLSKANGEITPWDKTDICYDARGLKNFVSYPYQATSYNTTQVCAGAGDSYTYDALNRVTSVTHSDGSAVSTAYSGAAARVTDEGNGTSPVQRISQVDGLGRLIAVCEMSATTLQYGLSPTPTNPCNSFFTGSGFLTTYQYDGLSNLTNVIQGSLTARKFTYDSLSRLLTASNPESGITCYGTWSSGYNSVCNSGYDNDGNLTQRTMLVPNQAANGTAVVTTTYKYDALNRLGSKSYNDGATLGSYYYYDQTTAFGKSLSHGIGRLTSEGIYNGTTWVNSAEFGYDPMGRIVFDGQNIPSQYNLSYGYDYAGDVTSMTNGAGVTFSPTYNVARRLLSLGSSWLDSSHPASLVSNVTYGPRGTTVGATFGNGVSETRQYYPRGWLKNITETGVVYSAGAAGTGNIIVSGVGNSNAQGSGVVTITGSEQNRLSQPATQSTGSMSLAGTEKCNQASTGCHVWDTGTVTITVNGYPKSTPYGQNSTTSTLASALANLFTSDSNSPVTATASGSSINFTSRASGSNTNYQMVGSVVSDLGGIDFWFVSSPKNMTGGKDTVYVYDAGTVNLTVGSYQATASFDNNTNNIASKVALALAASLNASTIVTATASGANVTITSKAYGANTNYTLTGSSSSSQGFAPPSFGVSAPATLTGGKDPASSSKLYDTGTASVTVNNYQAQVAYGQSSTAQSIASTLASAISNSPDVTANASGSATITITARNIGSNTNYSVSESLTSSDGFSPPSFALSSLGGLSGGITPGNYPGTIYGLSLGYAANGDVISANDSANGNWTYAHDDMNRLITSTCVSGCTGSYTYAYDRFGNRWQQKVTSGSGYNVSYAFDGNNRISGGVTYDPAGNMTFDGANYYTYDAENRLIGVGTGPGSSNIASYGYDAEGRRDSKTSSGLTLDYLYDLAGHQLAELTSSGTVNRQEIYAGGSHLGTYAGTTTYFHHADWLGTERARSNMTAQACETVASLPFGDGQTNSGNCGDPSPMHFTGKERDSESGLHYFGARYYGSSLGRFMSFDPVQMSRKKLLDPQQWNMYSYTRNNPLRFVDPDGREVKVLDPEALKRIKSTLPKDLQNQVTADKNGVLDKKAIDKIKSDDPNVKALKQAVDLKGTIEVKTDSKAQGFNFEYKSVEQVRQEVQKAGGDPSQITFPELYLGYTQKPSESPSGDFRVIVSDATGEAANAPESELAVTTAHELYGHALPGAEGKAWEHDNGGPVDHQIKNIEDHTRSLYPDK